jgi:outer membrane protein OmpA-like peptidoglycan-associated protein
MRILLTVLASLLILSSARAEGLPPSVTLPIKPSVDVVVETYGHMAVKVPGSADEVVVAGKHWSTRLDASGLAGDERAKWTTLVNALKKSGWQVVLGGQEWNPPYVSMKQVKGAKETWLFMWVGDDTSIEIVEKGDPPTKLTLSPPTDGIAKVGEQADFPFLKHFPGAKLSSSAHDESPVLVTLEEGKDPVIVASGSVIKRYDLPANTSGLEETMVYRDAPKAAGWTIVDLNVAVTTGDPNLTAHYFKGPVDLWAHVHAGGMLQVADAGAERAASKLKGELDRACKVAVYGVNFDFNKATLRPDATPALDAIAKLLTDFGDLKVELGGHTDNVGERAYNQKLSEQRVATVKTWLTKMGVAGERLTTRGYADTQPLVTNDSPENQAKNRRVELKKADCHK